MRSNDLDHEIGRLGKPYWPLIISARDGQVILHMAGGEFRLDPGEAKEFGRIFTAARLEALE